MTKKLFLMCLISALSITSAYAKCDGGEEVTNTAGTTFCKSNVALNWWSAAAWCKTNDLQLATMYEMCPSWDGNTGYKCSELAKSKDIRTWSASAYDIDRVFAVSLNQGNVGLAYRNDIGYEGHAFCR